MFPLFHHLINQQIFSEPPRLLILGGIYPDMAAAAGATRQVSHQSGAELYRWCRQQVPEALPLAVGVISHGVKPAGVDYFTDEQWPGLDCGWCFALGRPWIDKIALVTRLPEELLWWKSHNFVEIAYELLTAESHPGYDGEIAAALDDARLMRQAAAALAGFSGQSIDFELALLRSGQDIFSRHHSTVEGLADLQIRAFAQRHQVYDPDREGIVALLAEMREALRPGFPAFVAELTALVRESLAIYPF